MSAVLPAVTICERALRAIGAFPVTESAADGEQLREAMTWLDLIMAEQAGATRLWFLVPATLSLTLTNGTSVYNLDQALGANLPIDQIQFPVEALLQYPSGRQEPLPIVNRDAFQAIEEKTAHGPPRLIYIDRLPIPTLTTWPTPPSTDPNTWIIKLDVQTYAPNVAPAGVTGTQPQGSIQTNFRQAWQRWLIVQLAHDLGSGPIFKLPETSLNRFGKMASTAKLALESFENREHQTTPPVGEAWDGEDGDYYEHSHRYRG
jgi:hypothetical protein